MSKLDELLRELCPNGVEYKKLGEIATVLRGASPRPIKKYITNDSDGVNWIKIGDVPVGSKYITQSEEKITKEGTEKSRYVRKGDFILSNSMSFGRPYILAIDGCIHDGWLSISNFKDVFLSDYLYYLLSSSAIQQEMKKRASFGGAVQNLNADIVKALVLPVPPIEVQNEIVRILDDYTENVVELQNQLALEITARQRQYTFYRNKLLTYDSKTRIMPLKDVAEIERGTRVVRSQLTEAGLYPVFQNALTPMGYYDKANRLENNTFLICAGAAGQIGYSDVDFWAADDCYTFKCCEKLENRYLFHVLKNSQHRIDAQVRRASIPRISREAVGNIRIPIPPLDVQNRIVNVLDNFEKICSDLNIGLPAEIEARQKQYEYYRDKLLTFAETGNTILSRAEQSRAERLSWLDVLKGIGIILVVIGHVYSNRTVFNWLYSFHMPLFFLAAGWVYKEKSVLIDIKRRIQTIVVPYFSFGLLVLLYWQVIERRFRNSDMSFMDSLLGLFSGCYDNLDFNVHLWFLPCFFVTVALFNILVNLGGKKIAYIVSALMSLIYVVLPMPELFWGLNRVFKYIGFYALGVALAGQIKAGQVAERKITSGGIAIILIVLNFILAFYGLTRGLMWFVTAMIGVVGVGLMAMLINQNRLLQYLGRISLMVLCIHGPVYRIVVKIVSIPLHMSTDAVRENLLLALIVVAITLAICSIAYEVIIRIAPWMVGKRHNKAKKMSICG